MDLESPDWDRSPSLIEEVKTDPYTAPDAKQEDIKLEEVKLEDFEHEEAATTAVVLATPPASTTSTLPPPPKTPPIPPPTHRNRSARTTVHTPQPPRPKHHQADSKPPSQRPPPSPSSSTSSEDPVILTTNVPIPQKSHPGQPPHRLSPQLSPPSTVCEVDFDAHHPLPVTGNGVERQHAGEDRPSPKPQQLNQIVSGSKDILSDRNDVSKGIRIRPSKSLLQALPGGCEGSESIPKPHGQRQHEELHSRGSDHHVEIAPK